MKKIVGLLLVVFLLTGLVGSACAASVVTHSTRRIRGNIEVWEIDTDRRYATQLDVAKAASDWSITYDSTRITACSYKQTTYASPAWPYGTAANVSPQPTKTTVSYSTDFKKVSFSVIECNATATFYAYATRQNEDSAILPVESGKTRTVPYSNFSTVGSFTKPN